MSKYDPAPSTPIQPLPVEEPICHLCLEHNPIGSEVCRRCRAPLVTITGPTVELEGEDEEYRKPVALIGTWIIHGPIVAGCLAMMIWAIVTLFQEGWTSLHVLDVLSALLFFAICSAAGAVFALPLFRATRTFLRHRSHRRRRGFEPTVSDQSSDNPS